MTTQMYIRQSGILSPDVAEKHHVTICGCGTVGSNAAIQLAKLGICKFQLWDGDDVEIHNIASQAFTIDDVGCDKGHALKERLQQVIPEYRDAITTAWELEGHEQFNPGTALLAVDDMDMRKTIFQTSVKTDPLIDFLVDIRIGGTHLRAWAFDPRDSAEVAKYEKTLHSSEDSIQATCGTQAFAPVGALSGVIAAQLVTAHLSGRGRLPFYTQVDLDCFQISAAGGRKAEE